MTKKLLIIAGEASGDLHGSSLISELLKIDKDIEIYGIGGDKMIKEGMKTIYHINQMSFLGFIEVIKHLPFIKKVKRDIIDFAKKNDIKHTVLIDYPGFNLNLARSLNELKINLIYYISPQIWAWGTHRINKIRKYINRMIVFFPFEQKLYSANNVKTDFVGHPLSIALRDYHFTNFSETVKNYDLDRERDIILLLPGSRMQEVDKILPDLLEAANKIALEYNLQIVVACADNIDPHYFNVFRNVIEFAVVKGGTYNLLKNSKIAIVKSGTSTLEAGLIGTPFIVVYKTNFFTYLIGKALIKIKNIALANIVAEDEIVTELIQNDVNPNRIYNECKSLLEDETLYNELKNKLLKIKNKLATDDNPSRMAAEIVYTEINGI